MLSTGVQFILAETRTQEAGAPLPPISSLGRARDSYLNAAASVRETIAFARIIASEQARSSASAAAGAYGQAQNSVDAAAGSEASSGFAPATHVDQLDDEFDSADY